MSGLTSFQRPTEPGGYRYSTSWRCRLQNPGNWAVERWNGTNWEWVTNAFTYARCRQIPGEWEAKKAKS